MFSLSKGDISVIAICEEALGGLQNVSWNSLASGGLLVDSNQVVLCVDNSLVIQSLTDCRNTQIFTPKIKGWNDFITRKVYLEGDDIYLVLYFGNGRFYLYRVNRNDPDDYNLIEKHNLPNRVLFHKNKLISSGLLWTQYGKYLDRYDTNVSEGPTDEARKLFNRLFEFQRGFSLGLYDSALVLVDSCNFTTRTGADAQGYYSLYMDQPFDIAPDNEIYLVDNERGYIIEHYSKEFEFVDEVEIQNTHFKELPEKLDRTIARTLKSKDGVYSVTYAVYIKDQYLLSSFVHSARPPGTPSAPFFYDITTLGGETITTGAFDYPLVSEDDSNVYFLARVEGGWFEDDDLYLVGMTIEDIIHGEATKARIDQKVKAFIENREH